MSPLINKSDENVLSQAQTETTVSPSKKDVVSTNTGLVVDNSSSISSIVISPMKNFLNAVQNCIRTSLSPTSEPASLVENNKSVQTRNKENLAESVDESEKMNVSNSSENLSKSQLTYKTAPEVADVSPRSKQALFSRFGLNLTPKIAASPKKSNQVEHEKKGK